MDMKMDFINEKTGECFFLMFLPVMAAMFLNMAYNLVDSLWIGNLLGEEAYAALTASTPVILILNSIAMGASNGTAILISRAVGEGDDRRTERLLATSFVLSAVFAAGVTVFLEICLPAVLKLLNTPEEIWGMAKDYLAVCLVGYPAVYLYCYFTAVLRSYGNAVFQMAAMLICTVLNAVLDPVFIRGFGFRGAAAATLLSQTLCLVFMLFYLGKKKYFAVRLSSFSKRDVPEIIGKSVPSAFQQSIPAVSTAFLTSLVSGVSVTAIAAYGITGKLEIILFYPAMALNMVLTNIIGQCAGGGRTDRAVDYLKYSLKTGAVLLTVLSVCVIAAARPLSGLFIRSGDAAEIVAGYFRIVSIGYVLNTVTNCFLGALNGFGKPVKSLLLMVLYYMVVRIPLAYVLGHKGIGLDGIWTAVLVSHAVAALAAFMAGNHEIRAYENQEGAVV